MDFGYDEYGNRTSASNGDGRRGEEGRAEWRSAQESRGSSTSRSSGAEEDAHGRPLDSSDSEGHSDFSDDVELVIGEEGTQALHEPLVDQSELQSHGRRAVGWSNEAQFLLESRYAGREGTASSSQLLLLDGDRRHQRPHDASASQNYLDVLSTLPDRMRNVVVAGSLHHGKTSLVELLLHERSYHKRQDEVDREMTLKSHVLTTITGGALLQPTSRQITVIDTPGHPDLIGETAAGMRLADAVLFCVDAAESLSDHSERLLRHAIVNEQLPVVLVITKVDLLMIDIKLPPLDAYRKLRMVVDAVNNVIASCGTTYDTFLVSPERGTVCFSSAKLGLCFSLETFAMKYAAVYPSINAAALATKLWGQITYEKKEFKKIANFRQRPSFVQFVLEPLYKIVAHSVTGEAAQTLSPDLAKLPRSPLSALREAMRYFCGAPTGETLDAILSVLPAPPARSQWLSEKYGASALCSVTRDAAAAAAEGMEVGTATARADDLVIAVASLQRVFDAKDTLAAVVRVTHGTLRANSSSKSKGTCVPSGCDGGQPRPRLIAFDEFSSDADPYYEVEVQCLYLRTVEDGFVPVQRATAGQTVYATGLPARSGSHIVLVGGAAAAAVLAEDEGAPAPPEACGITSEWVAPIKVRSLGFPQPLVHVSMEVRDPAKASSVQDGLGVLLRTSPGLDVHKEETGEYTISGFGELQLDTALHELRHGLCPSVPVGISQPFVTFAETVQDAEGLLAMTGTRSNSVGFVSGALPRAFTQAIEYEQLRLFSTELDEVRQPRKLWTVLRRDYGFDALDAQHVLAAGPDGTKGPSILIDDTLAEEAHHPLKVAHQRAIVSAFRSTMAAGPLVGEMVRGVAAKLIFADIDASTRDAVVLSNARTALRHSLFGARPRLMEPVMAVEILCAPECVLQLGDILQQRRGAMLGEEPIAATTLIRARALVPAMDSFGLETQIRMLTHGQAFPLFRFHQWDVVPGDPFDASIHVGPLEPARGHQLARDFVLKTRFRKGLPQNMLTDL
ncbi:U5 small nuclear ribonucleoprotein component / Snu114 / U5-116K [Leishmania donovani]|uniref:Elongation factor Tu GTP binding domain family protein n=1 Tax=Leishmania donovani TaxID=5661 RepID=A0A504XM83_LEIDO|nr:Elongation factor Tu GTP binding domain family protein [Leishmania donovani]CAJ1991765.1 U5 small nuclear ribonucleoprotein component / Snu114 / U5-116K [Leishmania donovani]VDZ47604.1 U5_small_nuclear_ribonucleoprotein_component_putative/GeneDB:LmjF.32.2200 [Leishmania donovani]